MHAERAGFLPLSPATEVYSDRGDTRAYIYIQYVTGESVMLNKFLERMDHTSTVLHARKQNYMLTDVLQENVNDAEAEEADDLKNGESESRPDREEAAADRAVRVDSSPPLSRDGDDDCDDGSMRISTIRALETPSGLTSTRPGCWVI